ncbi:MarR family winged helix-turn-helix transcriptional regulator [Ruicaihuangia caeni]|uniref:MarR family transcriptional regulator n=1 Tax=Ruicaihuangia caeni TaxID=3042517 RepID=A0AAW6T5X9_9MICO|nr:MarR family transcriptional regulator [Klugiella sp. YN-L-19]MDI2098476.1 MarR family transcriptional regulator [Klugiella sp. YN-L-19]
MDRSVPRMDAAESRAWLALVSTAELLPAALDAQLQADSQLTHFEFIALTVLKDAEHNTLRMKELAAATNATLPRLSKVATRLESRGLVERQARSDDGRAIDVRLTTAGRRALVLATPGHIETVRRLVIDHLAPEQLDALADALEPLVQRLDPQARWGPKRISGRR